MLKMKVCEMHIKISRYLLQLNTSSNNYNNMLGILPDITIIYIWANVPSRNIIWLQLMQIGDLVYALISR